MSRGSKVNHRDLACRVRREYDVHQATPPERYRKWEFGVRGHFQIPSANYPITDVSGRDFVARKRQSKIS
jgi:hypothetical protein